MKQKKILSKTKISKFFPLQIKTKTTVSILKEKEQRSLAKLIVKYYVENVLQIVAI